MSRWLAIGLTAVVLPSAINAQPSPPPERPASITMVGTEFVQAGVDRFHRRFGSREVVFELTLGAGEPWVALSAFEVDGADVLDTEVGQGIAARFERFSVARVTRLACLSAPLFGGEPPEPCRIIVDLEVAISPSALADGEEDDLFCQVSVPVVDKPVMACTPIHD